MAETFDSIAAEVKKKNFSPVYCLCGEEAYFIDSLTDLIEKHALNDMERAFNQTIVYGKDVTARQLMEICGRLPMMAERQLVIIKEAQSLNLKEDEAKQYLAYLKNPVKSTILVFAWKHGTPDGRRAFGMELKKKAVYFESKPFYDSQVIPWIKKWVTHEKYKIDDQAVDLLVEFTGNDISKLVNELGKLIINKEPGGTITADDIEKGVGLSKEFNVFELSNALGNHDLTKAYRITNYFVANPKNGPMVVALGTLHAFFWKVYIYRTNKDLPEKDLATAMKVSPFFIKDYKTAAKHYNERKLEQIFYMLEEYDLRLKGVNNTSIKESELLKELVARILN